MQEQDYKFTGAKGEDRIHPDLRVNTGNKTEEVKPTLIEQLKTELKVAMKTGNFLKRNLIRVILSDIDNKEKLRGAKRFTDVDVQVLIRKFHKDMGDIVRENLDDDKVQEIDAEMKILDEYLPQLMSEEDITTNVVSIIENLGIDSIKDMGKVMGGFNKMFPGKADNKLVSKIVKEKLS